MQLCKYNMKILFIDPVCFPSHSNFNRLHIEALKRTGAEIDLILKKDYWEQLGGIFKDDVVYEIPTKRKFLGGIVFRLYLIIIFILIRLKINLKNYDKIIISYYDEIAIYFSNFPCSYLINHINISGLGNKVKFWFFRRISKRHKHIVLESCIKDYLKELNINNVFVVRHGLIMPDYKIDVIEELHKYDYVIFSPSSVSSDELLLHDMINSMEFKKFLYTTNTLLIIKSETITTNDKNILILKGYLSDSYYKALLSQSDIILITYPTTYKYRSSGVLLESIAYKKYVIMSDIEILRQYEYLFGSDAYFSDTRGLIHAILSIYKRKDKNLEISDVEIAELMPDYSEIVYE